MHPPKPVPLEDVDLANLDVFVRDEAWGMFDTLRREAPVFWNPEPGGNRGFWSVTRFDDIEQVDKDPEIFTSERFVNLEEPPEQYMDLRRSMLETDGPRHQALRKLLMRDFSPATAAPLRGLPARAGPRHRRCRAAAGGVRLRRRDRRRLPDRRARPTARRPGRGHPAARLLGQRDRRFHRPGLRAASSSTARKPRSTATCRSARRRPSRSSSTAASSPPNARAATATTWSASWCNRIPEDGVPLTPTDFDNYFLLLVVAGNETTRQAISHSMKALMDNPDQLAFLRDNPDKSQIAVEELLRFASPVYHFRRTATRDVEMARPADQGGRQGRHVVRLGQPRRGGLRRPVPAGPDPLPERAHDVRQGRAHLHGREPGPARDPDHVRDAAAPPGLD